MAEPAPAESGLEPEIPVRTRRAFGVLEVVAPGIGARWAARLWCTPPVFDAVRMPPGIPAGESVEAFWDGHRVAGEAWGEGPIVYLVHGWGGRRPHLAMFIKPLTKAGFRVIAVDLPAHNESDAGAMGPGRTTIGECGDAVAAMIAAHGPAHAVVAHSMGAKAVALAATRGTPVGRLVFLAPMGDFADYLDHFAQRHGFGPRTRRRLHRRLDGLLGVPLYDTDVVRLAPHTGYPPLLLVHDPDDPDAPMPPARRSRRPGPARNWSRRGGWGVWPITDCCGISPRSAPGPRSSRPASNHVSGDEDDVSNASISRTSLGRRRSGSRSPQGLRQPHVVHAPAYAW
nr:alpha/beta fold hydrolase [Gordonia phthalatica]